MHTSTSTLITTTTTATVTASASDAATDADTDAVSIITRFPRSHAFDLMLRLLNGDSCGMALSEHYVHPCGSTNGHLCNAMLHAASTGSEVGRGVHGVVRSLHNLPALERRLGGRSVVKICMQPLRDMQRGLRSIGADQCMPQFVSEMVHAALMASLVDVGTSPHLVRAGPFATSGDAACYAMERMDGDLAGLVRGRLSAESANGALLAVVHTLMLLQETFRMTHNDLKPGNVFVAPLREAERDLDWFGYELDGDDVAWCRSPGFIVKIGDPGVAVTHRIRMSGMERALTRPMGPRELVRNRMPIKGKPIVGQWVRVIKDGKTITDGIVKSAESTSHIIIRNDNIFTKVVAANSPNDIVETSSSSSLFPTPASSSVVVVPSSSSSSALSSSPLPDESGSPGSGPYRIVDRRSTELLSLNAAYETFGVHGAYQPGYDLHFFIIHFTTLVRSHGIKIEDVPLLRAIRTLHPFESCESDDSMPKHVRETMRPRHDNVFPMSAKETLDHPAVRKVMMLERPSDVPVTKARVVAKAHVQT